MKHLTAKYMQIKLNTVRLVMGMFLMVTFSQSMAEIKFEDDFDSGDLDTTTGGYKWTSSNGNAGFEPVVSTDIARSGSYSLKFRYRGGSSSTDSWSEQRMEFGEQLTNLYVQFWIYYPDGTEGLGAKYEHRNPGVNNNKFFRTWNEDYTDYEVKVGFSTRAFQPPTSGFISEFAHNAEGLDKQGTDVSRDTIGSQQLGKWLQVNMHVTADTGSGAVMQLWINGLQVLNNPISNFPDGGIGNYFRHAYFLGWANSGFDDTTYIYIDDVTISDTQVGSLLTPPKPPVVDEP